ncbi:MAG TPA: hypothetical protein VLI45_00785 [Acidobacteriaceae bacterium]|nr:hypothetical protein [Acidobacteriaceae bacterium]
MRASSFGSTRLIRGVLMLAVLFSGFLIMPPASGQAPPKINVPYRCANGLTYTVLACKPYRADQWCTWKQEQNGNLVTTANSAWTSMTGRLQGCTTAGPAADAAPAGAGDYTSDLPSVDRVKAEIKGTDATDTLARQQAVFSYLGQCVDRIKSNRSVRGAYTPEEQRVMTAYALAAQQIAQEYQKTHTAEQTKAFNRLEFNYMMNQGEEWSRKLMGPQSAAAYSRTLGQMNARQQAHVDAVNRRNEEAENRPAEAPPTTTGPGDDNPNDPTIFASHRCAELGGQGAACAGKGLMSGLMGLIGMDTDVAFATSSYGVVLGGNYHSRTEVPSISFDENNAAVADCGKLVADGRKYAIRKSGLAVQVVVSAEPNPIVLNYRPDGTLAGPGTINLKGRIITGYTTSTRPLYVGGVPATCNGYAPCTSSSVTPIYGTAMARCTIGNLAAPPSPPPPSTEPARKDNGPVGLLTSFTDTGKGPAQPGLRMSGPYADPSGLVLNFENGNVILDCGRAHVRQPYRVENAPSTFVVHVENSGGPFTLTVAPDGTLRGAGHTTVNGRLFAGLNGDHDLTFRPVSASCDVGTFSKKSGEEYKALISNMPSPAGSAGASPAEASYAPRTGTAGSAPALGSAVTPVAGSGARAAMHVVISSKFPAARNPLAGQVVSIRRESMSSVLRKLGVSIPPNATAGEATQTLFSSCKSIDCRAVVANLKSYDVSNIRLDANGSYTVNVNETTGPYFFDSMVRLPDGSFSVWEVPVNLRAGENTVIFQPEKAQTFKLDPNAAR